MYIFKARLKTVEQCAQINHTQKETQRRVKKVRDTDRLELIHLTTKPPSIYFVVLAAL